MNDFDITKISDEEINKAATELITGECWHEIETNLGSGNFGKCVKCENVASPRRNFTSCLSTAFILVNKLWKDAIDSKDDEFLNYEAFARHIKQKQLNAGHYTNPQPTYFEEYFLLFHIQARTLTEACLLSIGYGQNSDNKTEKGE